HGAQSRRALFELRAFARRDARKGFRVNAHVAHDRVAHHDDTVFADGAHRQLRLSGKTDLADEDDIERRVQRGRDFGGDRYAAARKSEHDGVFQTGTRTQGHGQPPAGVDPVHERHGTTVPGTGAPGQVRV